jgi:hypothetical protein
MPNLGSVQGQTFAFPYPQQQAGGQQQGVANAGQPQMGMETPDSLQFVRGKTKEVYDKFYKLKQFTSSMWKNHRIDVTNPDFNDELSMKANQIYQESIADLKFTADDLKNSQRMLEKDATKSGQRIASGYDLQSQPYSRGVGQAFVSDRGITPGTATVLEDYQRLFYDKNTRNKATENLKNYASQLEQNLSQAQQSGRADLVETISQDLQKIHGALYSSEKDDMLGLRYKIADDRGKDKIDYTNLWEQWDQVRQGDLRSLEGQQGKYGPIFVPNSLHYNYAKGKISGKMKINAKGDTRDVELDINDIRGGYLQLLQEHDPSYKEMSYDALLNNTKEIRAKFPDLKDASYESDPDFFRSMEFVVGDLTGGGKEGEYKVKGPKGKETGEVYETNEEQYKGSILRLNEIAETRGLRLPKSSSKFVGIPEGTVITKAELTRPWIGKPKIRITLENEVGSRTEELDPSNIKDRNYLRDLVYENDVTMNNSVTPNYTRKDQVQSETQPEVQIEDDVLKLFEE